MTFLVALVMAANLNPAVAFKSEPKPEPKPEPVYVAPVVVTPEPEPVVAGGAPLCDSACIECESSWNPMAHNPAGYWGLYQYDYSSWVSDGGDPNTYGSAGAAEQHAVAANAPFDRWPNC